MFNNKNILLNQIDNSVTKNKDVITKACTRWRERQRPDAASSLAPLVMQVVHLNRPTAY